MQITSINSELTFDPQRPIIKVLLDTDFTKEIRITMHQGTIMKEHKTHFPIVVHVVEGAISFGVNNQVLELITGDMIALNPSVPHDLKAHKNSVIRLTLSKQDTVERVERVVE